VCGVSVAALATPAHIDGSVPVAVKEDRSTVAKCIRGGSVSQCSRRTQQP